MHVEFLVEDRSTGEVVKTLIHRICGPDIPFTYLIRPFDGKEDMMQLLPGYLRRYAGDLWVDAIIVAIDQDKDDCRKLKRQIVKTASRAGLASHGKKRRLTVRIVVTELETWFLGDPQAVRAEFPLLSARDIRVDGDVENLQDAWERLEKPLIRRGYFTVRMPKIEVARRISARLNLDSGGNVAHSFGVFVETVRSLCNRARAETQT